MKLMINIKIVLVSVVFLLIGLQDINAQECLLDTLNDELVEANSDEVFKYFEENPGKGYNPWYVLYKANKDASRLEVSSLKDLSSYLKSTGRKVDDVIEEIKASGGYKVWKLNNQEGSFVNALTKLDQKNASIDISWKNLDSKTIIWGNPNSNKFYTAKAFVEEKGSFFYDILLDEGKYVKFDLESGMILLGNTDGTYRAFAVMDTSVLGTFKSSLIDATEEVVKSKLSSFLYENAKKLEVLSGKVSKTLDIPGGLPLNPNKVNTLLGRYKNGIDKLFNELGSFKNIGLGETKGGINLLNKPDNYYNLDTWWDAHNKGWLDNAIDRGDDIYLVTIPEKAQDLIDESGNLLGAYARELNHLVVKKYKPKNVTDSQWASIKSWLNNLANDVSSKVIVNNIGDFLKLTKLQKIDYLKNAWKAYYPQIFFERKLFENMMGRNRYLKSSGWGHTDDIAHNFKAIDFYNDFTKVGDDIFASTVVSMKTTTTKNVDNWLASNPIKKNLDNLEDGMSTGNGITWNGITIKYSKAEVHIYMPKAHLTPELKKEWLNKLATARPDISFRINILEDFIK